MQIARIRNRAQAAEARNLPKGEKRSGPPKKTMLFIAIGVVTMAVLAVVCIKLFFTTAEAIALTGTTTFGSFSQTIEGTGITIPADSVTYTTASDTEILEVLVSAGDVVEKGDLLYIQDDAEVDDAIEEYQNEIADNQDSLADYATQLSDLQEELAGLRITAPLAGRLSGVTAEVGDTVRSGDVLATLVDDASMTLTQYFSYAYEGQIGVGMTAVLSIPDLMTSLNGTVTEIKKVERITAEGTKCFAVTVTVQNPGALAADMEAGGYLLDGAEKLYPAVEGTLKAAGSETITAGGNGVLTMVNAVDYQTVSSGETLFIIDDGDYQTKGNTLRTQTERAQEKIVALTEKIAQAEESRDSYRVCAEIDGKVIACVLRVGERPAKGRTAVMIYDLTTMSITANIDELDIDYIQAGMTAQIIRAGAERDTTYEGIVTEVALEATSSGGVATFPVTMEIDSGGALAAGVNVSYSLSVGDTGEGVLAPVAAVQYTDEGTCLFVKADTKPETALELADGVVPEGYWAIPVEVGTSSGRQVRILSGAEQELEVFLGYQQSAPSGGDSTSAGQGETDSETTSHGGMGGEVPDMGGGFPGGGMGGSRPN